MSVRFKWPLPSEAYFRESISVSVLGDTEAMVLRLRFVWEELGPPSDMLGNIQALRSLDELQVSYVCGNFLATVLLSQSFIEHSLGNTYYFKTFSNSLPTNFAALVDTTHQLGIINNELAANFHKLRKLRNPYTHHSLGVKKGSYMRRIVATGMHPDEMLSNDAEFALTVVADFIRHQNPEWNPETVLWDEASGSTYPSHTSIELP